MLGEPDAFMYCEKIILVMNVVNLSEGPVEQAMDGGVPEVLMEDASTGEIVKRSAEVGPAVPVSFKPSESKTFNRSLDALGYRELAPGTYTVYFKIPEAGTQKARPEESNRITITIVK